ncbi:MAG: hypothetical protein V4726_09345 [Verrucomicrobiota bacterium]
MFKALARFFGFFSRPRPEPQRSGQAQPQPRNFSASRPLPDSSAAPAADPPRVVAEEARAAAEQRAVIDTAASPEAICGITPGMSQAEISDILARLYQRHNRAASSFDSQLRTEAEFMLDIVAGLREKYLSRPPGE